MTNLIDKVEERFKTKKLVDIKPGMWVKVYYRTLGKANVQPFTGLVISVKNKKKLSTTFKVRGEAAGQWIEKTYPLHSPLLEKIQILKKYKVRRAKLYFVRNLSKLELRSKLRKEIK